MKIKRPHTDLLIEWRLPVASVCYIDDGLTAAEQAVMDADRNAELEENAATGQTGETTPPPADDGAGDGDTGAEGDGAAPATEGQPQRQGMVPHAAMHEERTRRQDVERQLAEERLARQEERRARQTLEERTNLILERFAAPQQQPTQAGPMLPEIPAFDQDPAGHILGQVRQQGAILGELVQAVTGQNRQNEAQAGVQQLTVRAAAMEREFAAANPDYDKASAHLFDMRRQELMAAGWSDPAEIHTMMVNEATGLAARALQQGRNPAEVVYQLAKLRGYNGAPAGGEAPGNGAQLPAAAEGQLRTIAAGQQQSRPVRGSGPVPLTAARLAEMSPEEFSKMMQKKEGRDLMGV